MSRRRGEFEHRTSIFEGAYRAWSHLGGLEPDDLDTKPLSDLNPVDHPLDPDPRDKEKATQSTEEEVAQESKSASEVKKEEEDGEEEEKDGEELESSKNNDESSNNNDNKRQHNKIKYPYEPLPRSGLAHPYVRAVLKAWLGSNVEHDVVQVGLTTLRTWWQHRRKGESSTAINFLGTPTMQQVLNGYTRSFFQLAHSLVLRNEQQPPRTLHKKSNNRWENTKSKKSQQSNNRTFSSQHASAEENIQLLMNEIQKISEIVAVEYKSNATNTQASKEEEEVSANGNAASEDKANVSSSTTKVQQTVDIQASANYDIIENRQQEEGYTATMPLVITTDITAPSPQQQQQQQQISTVQALAEIAQLRLQVGSQVNAICDQYPSLACIWQMLDEEKKKKKNVANTLNDSSNIPNKRRKTTITSNVLIEELKIRQEHMGYQRKIMGIQSLQTILHERLDRAEQRYTSALKETNRLEEAHFLDAHKNNPKLVALMEGQKRTVEQLEGTMESITSHIRENEEEIHKIAALMESRYNATTL